MRVAMVQFASWDKFYAFDPGDLVLKAGDFVVVTTSQGTDLGKVIEFSDLSEEEINSLGELRPIDRLAAKEEVDLFMANNNVSKKEQTIDYSHKNLKKYNLEMKLVDCYFSFDDSRMILAFIADGRVDFRNLVKDLTRHFQKSVRLHQLGVRDEVKISGDIGSCGQGLCCQGHLKKLGNVTSEYAENQQVAHRGSERLSGICGRLKCCLSYENDLYEELAGKLPAVGTRVKTKHGRGKIISKHILKGSVDVEIDSEKEGDKRIIVEVPIK
ncbi:MAG: regulatory iron-sulfur-containing complex subunit RicT [Candidatus Buchananbacteria bacterium]|nr:regulatory iron-sulfur-containing complex subunit RicT [Candidatus Buchananbacteria bacterium]